jgi:hypothetical protein
VVRQRAPDRAAPVRHADAGQGEEVGGRRDRVQLVRDPVRSSSACRRLARPAWREVRPYVWGGLLAGMLVPV